jgi:hypothetical protein
VTIISYSTLNGGTGQDQFHTLLGSGSVNVTAGVGLMNLVFAEALSQSTFGGFIVTVLVHTDMASPHLHHAGNAAQLARRWPGETGVQRRGWGCVSAHFEDEACRTYARPRSRSSSFAGTPA